MHYDVYDLSLFLRGRAGGLHVLRAHAEGVIGRGVGEQGPSHMGDSKRGYGTYLRGLGGGALKTWSKSGLSDNILAHKK